MDWRLRQPDIIPAEDLLEAYRQGIFPMADSVTGEVAFYHANPRGVIELERFHVPRRLMRSLRSSPFEIRVDTAFAAVVDGCGSREDTWISDVIYRSYVNLHQVGYAHSVESWRDGELVGGLYGVAIRGAFFGESMFHRVPDASKAALVALVERLQAKGFTLLDTQMVTPLTQQFGARLVSEKEYHRRLRRALLIDTSF